MTDEEEVEGAEKEEEEEAAATATAAAAASSSTAAAMMAMDDTSVAQRLHSIDQLTEIFGFPRHLAEVGVDAVGNPFDVTAAYNYLLDKAEEEDGSGDGQEMLVVDKGGPVTPIFDCPHAQDRVRLTPSQLPFRPQACRCTYLVERGDNQTAAKAAATTGQKKAIQGDDGSCPGNENWLCLQCGVVRCGRYSNAHGVAHWKETQAKEEEDEVVRNGINKGKLTGAVGHCLSVGLADLSVWCHMCRAYVLNPSLRPLLTQLEALKFQEWSSTPVLELLGPGEVGEGPAANANATPTAAATTVAERKSPCSPCTPQKKRARSNPSHQQRPQGNNDTMDVSGA